MHYSKVKLFSQDQPAEDLNDDELDELFGQLEHFEPPAFLVESIMATVNRRPAYSQPPKTTNPTEYLNNLLAGNKLGE